MDNNRPFDENSAIGKSIVTENAKNEETVEEALTEDQILLKLAAKIAELDEIKLGMNSFNIAQDERLYFDRKVRPLIDCVYFLALSSNSVANTATLMQSNTYGRKHEIRQALSLSHDMNKEIEELFDVLKKRTDLFKEGIEQELGQEKKK